MKCPNCNKRLLTRKERKYKHCLRCGHDFSLIKGKVEFVIAQYCIDYADYIFVPEKIEGKLQPTALSKLPEVKKAEFISKCINKKCLPIRLKTPKELDKGSE